MRRLTLVAAIEAGILLTAFNVLFWVRGMVDGPARNDFRLDYATAQIGLARGWDRIYSLNVQAMTMQNDGFFFQPYISPPALSFAAAPLTGLPFGMALALWTIALVAGLACTWWLLAPGGHLEKAMQLALCLGLFPVVFAITIGQPAPFGAVVIAIVWWLLKRQREWEAGLVLSLIVVKPQLGFLVPLALLAAGHVKAFLGWLASSAVLGALFFAAVGPAGVRDYLADLTMASHWTLTQHFTIGELVGHGSSLLMIQIGLLVLTVCGAWLQRHRGPELPLAIGISGSLLVTPYIGFQDFLMLVVAAWLTLRVTASPVIVAVIAAGYVALEFGLMFGTLPVVICELAFLVAICFAGVHAGVAVRERVGSALAPRAVMKTAD
jgi:hypothetical protein